MAGGKETPRQKMIGMMYLFLTCMLALNVSKDILDAFININNRLNETNENFISKNQIVYDAIFKAYSANPIKVKAAYDYSLKLKEKSDSLVGNMQYYKDTIIVYADGLDKNKLFKKRGDYRYYTIDDDTKDTVMIEDIVKNKDNTDKPAEIMVGSDPSGAKGEARHLKEKIDNYRNWTLKTIQEFGADSISALGISIKNTFNTNPVRGGKHESGNLSWANRNFEHLPLIAVVTILTQMQASVRNIEGDILNLMYGQLDAESFKFNKLVPIILPNSTYVMQGNEYNAKIFLAAFDTTAPPTVIVNGKELPLDPKTNLPMYKLTASGLGQQKYKAEIKIKQPNSDNYTSYFESGEYQVARPNLVVSPTKMNVFYVGPDNPVDISVPGVPSDKISASLTPAGFGSIVKSPKGGYIVRVTRPGKCKVAVVADIDGRRQNMGAVEFRIKTVPDPVAAVLGMEGGNITKQRLMAATVVEAKMKDFDFDLKFSVNSFRVSAKIGQYFVEENSPNNRITQNMKNNIFNKLTRGNKVYFEDVRAIGPDKRTRKLGVLLFEIQ